ncbi:NEDD8-activating enzyme E1 regulatory subunit APP-BP1 [Collichthys lucidus]|uniref:NEDD8-activating enzyme E1 regulatory subunit n=1 Tax=Collichthys lucidus TaxID=240159 RepID=A0A4U5U7I7_COLLU|nr:NEDD8-activating enzyme E1 regulatory subunit APP-BP1 [Collichthys lucidus]
MAASKSSKEQKYDRQLRLWGDHGQEALENAHVCLINATATGTEILKNLVLPGIGAFTVVDGHTVSGEDVGNNFFLSNNSIGKNRAQAATELLQELNSDVCGNFVEESPDKLLDNDPEFFHRFTIVIGVHLPESTCLRLGSVLWSASVPFLVCKTYGLIGYMRLVVQEHTVIESHPDNALEDLRLDQPFAEFKNHIQSYDLDSMDKKDHSHTPWIIVVAKCLEKWLSEHNCQLPKNYKEKEAFRQLIREGILKKENGVPEDEENFEEAIKNVNTALNPTKTLPFWVMLRAVKEFVLNEGNGSLPVRGTIPDMIADSQKFINLQNVSLAEEYSVDSVNKDEITSCMDNPDSEMVFYLMLRAVDRFYQQHSRYPGVYNYQVEEDISKLKLCVNSLLQEYSLNVNIKDDYIHEFCRYGAAEPHTVAAFLGGSAAQEAIKIISHQFVPFSNTFIYNAMSQTSATLQL